MPATRNTALRIVNVRRRVQEIESAVNELLLSSDTDPTQSPAADRVIDDSVSNLARIEKELESASTVATATNDVGGLVVAITECWPSMVAGLERIGSSSATKRKVLAFFFFL
jgi:hypothetical protein